jgi:hypothetical protein
LRTIVEKAGGTMHHEKAGHGQGGSWIVVLNGHETVFQSNGAGFPPMDRLYVPKVENPRHYNDYSCTLKDGSREEFLKMLGSGG